MTLDFTMEERDLLRIRQEIAFCWRMNSRQLGDFRRKMLDDQQGPLPGRLGGSFLGLLGRTADGTEEIRWPDLLEDVEHLLKLIHKYAHSDKEIWNRILPRLEERQDEYFKTELGRSFVRILRDKLGAGAAAQAHPVEMRIAAGADSRGPGLYDEKELEKIALWLMDDTPGMEAQEKRRSAFPGRLERAAALVFACLSLCFMGIWLRGQAVLNRNSWHVQQLKTAGAQEADAFPQENQKAGVEAADLVEKLPDRDSVEKLPDRDSAVKQVQEAEEPEEPEPAPVPVPDVLPQYEQMAEEYPELFGWLKIPGTEIDTPVMKSEGERDFYLHHDFAGAESAEGTLFVDRKSSGYPQDDNIVIYGHNMKNGHMFGMLQMYSSRAFFDEHREICFDTLYETGLYEAQAVLKTRILNENETGFRYYQFFNCKKKKEFRQLKDFVKENQIYETDGTLQYGDRILMLSTCEYSQENGRFVVVARKLD